MSDNFENRNDLTPETTPVEPEVTPVAQETPVAPVAEEAAAAPQETEVKPDAPVEGEYRFRTYDLNRRQEPQATFGNADWQWQPAEAVEQPRKKRKKIRWGKVLLSSAAVILAAAIITMSRLSKKIRREIREIDAKLRECEDRLEAAESPQQP